MNYKNIKYTLIILQFIFASNIYAQPSYFFGSIYVNSPEYVNTSTDVLLVVLDYSNNPNYQYELQKKVNGSWITVASLPGYSGNIEKAFYFRDANLDDGINTFTFKAKLNGSTVSITNSPVFDIVSDDKSSNINCARFNDVFRLTGHNTYEDAVKLPEMLDSKQSIEIDFHHTGPYGKWEVRHFGSGNQNNCGNGNEYFDVCLNDIVDWSNSNPNHEVITLFLDVKSDWENSTGKGTQHLDNLLSNTFGSKLFTPADLKGTSSTLRLAASGNNWPFMNDLRGKIICVLTNGKINSTNDELNEYVTNQGINSKAFIAPTIQSIGEMEQFQISTTQII